MRRLTVLFMLAALLQSAGCVPFEPTIYSDADGNVVVAPKKVEPKKVILQGKRRYDDVPVPAGYGIDFSRSQRYERSNFRRVSLLYRQSRYMGEDRDRAFVKRFFPQAGWTLRFMYGVKSSKFIFHKGNEECRVEVKEDRRRHFTEISVEIEPRKTPSGVMVARSVEAASPTK